MGSGVSRWWKTQTVKIELDTLDKGSEGLPVDASRFISSDQEIVYSGELWKLNYAADPQAQKEWLKRWMWLTDSGGFFYYSRQFHKPLGCYVAPLEIRTPESQVLGRFLIELGVDHQLGVKPTVLACETAEARLEWVKCLVSVQDRERKRGEDKISPLEPFVGHGLHTGRTRLNSLGIASVTNSLTLGGSACALDFKTAKSASSSSSTLGSGSENSGSLVCRKESFGDRMMSSLSAAPMVCPQASTGPSIFASRGPSQGGAAPKMRAPIRRNSQAGFADRLQTILILDWDDTLFPTTFVRKDCGLDWRIPIAEQVQPGPGRVQVEKLLERLSQRVEAFVNLACSLAQVVIVTLASAPWVSTSSQNFMPGLCRVLQQQGIEVVYAREKISEKQRQEYAAQAFKTSADEANYWMRAKARAMEEAIQSFYGTKGASWKNLISIGDSDFERVALATVAAEHFQTAARGGQIVETGHTSMAISKEGQLQRLRAKTIKMLDEPSCEELLAQATLFQSWLPHIINKDSGMDVDMVGSLDDNYLCEVNQHVTGKVEALRWRDLASVE